MIHCVPGGPLESGLDVSIKSRDIEMELSAEADDFDSRGMSGQRIKLYFIDVWL